MAKVNKMRSHLLVFGANSYVFNNVLRFGSDIFSGFHQVTLSSRSPLKPVNCNFSTLRYNHILSDLSCALPFALQQVLEDCTHILFLPELKYISPIISFLESIKSKACIVALSSSACFTKLPSRNKKWRLKYENICINSKLNITLLRCNMIFGGFKDRNISKLMFLCRRSFFIFVPFQDHAFPVIQPLPIFDLLTCIHYAFSLPNPTGVYNLSGPYPIDLFSFITLICRVNNKFLFKIPVPASLITKFLSFVSGVLPRSASFRIREFMPRFMENKSLPSDFSVLTHSPQNSYSALLLF